MPDLQQALNARLLLKKEEEQNAKQNDAILRLAQEKEAFQRLDRLLSNEDWQWFRVTYLDGYVDEKKETSEIRKALNTRTPQDVRNSYAHRYEMAQEIIGKLEKTHTQIGNRIKGK